MDEKTIQTLEDEQETRQGSGSMLAAERKKQGKTVEEIAAELNLSIAQIKTIELDQTDGLPEPTYVRGYIRSYANLLKMDTERVLKNYLNPNWQQGTNLDDMPRGIPNADELSDRRWLTPGKLVSILLLLALAAFLWFSGILAGILGEKKVPLANQSDVSSELLVTADDGETLVEQFVVQQGEDDEIVVPSENSEQEAGNELVLNFTQTSWVDIRDEEDNRLAYKSYAEGEDLTLNNDGVMSIFIGNADGVTVAVNGEPFSLAEHREGVYAKFSVGQE